jgi:hypothetical protein
VYVLLLLLDPTDNTAQLLLNPTFFPYLPVMQNDDLQLACRQGVKHSGDLGSDICVLFQEHVWANLFVQLTTSSMLQQLQMQMSCSGSCSFSKASFAR